MPQSSFIHFHAIFIFLLTPGCWTRGALTFLEAWLNCGLPLVMSNDTFIFIRGGAAQLHADSPSLYIPQRIPSFPLKSIIHVHHSWLLLSVRLLFSSGELALSRNVQNLAEIFWVSFLFSGVNQRRSFVCWSENSNVPHRANKSSVFISPLGGHDEFLFLPNVLLCPCPQLHLQLMLVCFCRSQYKQTGP